MRKKKFVLQISNLNNKKTENREEEGRGKEEIEPEGREGKGRERKEEGQHPTSSLNCGNSCGGFC